MLYVTTRNTKDAFTVSHAINRNRCADGGLYVPYQLQMMTEDEIMALKDKSFSQCVADVLNLFFGAKLSSFDIDLCIGRYSYQMNSMSHKITVAEIWHNPDSDFDGIVRRIGNLLKTDAASAEMPSNWVSIAVRIAVLFGIFSELYRDETVDVSNKVDVSVSAGDFQMPMAVWYARQMGLPIGTIICGCNQNGTLWDLIHHGQMKTDTVAVQTLTPKCDYAVAPNLERLIFSCLGEKDVHRYAEACAKGGLYVLSEDQTKALSAGLFSAVVSDRRMKNVINSVYRTNQYLLDPYSALAFGALQDFRAVAGETRPALILSESSASCSSETVAEALGITPQELLDRIYTK